jgi:hypothetical protein
MVIPTKSGILALQSARLLRNEGLSHKHNSSPSKWAAHYRQRCGGGGGDPRNGVSTRGMQSLLSPIKSEPMTDGNNNAHLYRFSPSPAPSMRYHSFPQGDVRAGTDSQTNRDIRPPMVLQRMGTTTRPTPLGAITLVILIFGYYLLVLTLILRKWG